MKKKIFTILIACMLLFGVAGQAMAYFTNGELIRVVYKTGGTGNEFATDLGAFSATAPISGSTLYNTDNFSLASFPGASMADLNVAYFLRNPAGGNPSLWVSGPAGGQMSNAGQKASAIGVFQQVLNLYVANASGHATATIASSTANSYWQGWTRTGVGVGSFANFAQGERPMKPTLQLFSRLVYVDQYLY